MILWWYIYIMLRNLAEPIKHNKHPLIVVQWDLYLKLKRFISMVSLLNSLVSCYWSPFFFDFWKFLKLIECQDTRKQFSMSPTFPFVKLSTFCILTSRQRANLPSSWVFPVHKIFFVSRVAPCRFIIFKNKELIAIINKLIKTCLSYK